MLKPEQLEIYDPQGNRFLTTLELSQQAEQERQRAEQAEAQLEQEKLMRQRLVDRLKSLGVDSDLDKDLYSA